MKKDSGIISNFAMCILTLLFVGAMMLLSIQYSMAARTKFNVENALVESAFAGFRSNEEYYVAEGNFNVSSEVFQQSRYSFTKYLKKNLNLRAPLLTTPILTPQEDSYIPYINEGGHVARGELEEFFLYAVSGGANTDVDKIQHYEWRNGSGETHTSSVAGDIVYGGETVLKKTELAGNAGDRMLILCAKVRFPQTNLLRMGTTETTKTCCVRWKSRHEKKQED